MEVINGGNCLKENIEYRTGNIECRRKEKNNTPFHKALAAKHASSKTTAAKREKTPS
jgi:hypothetical protein